MHLFQKFARVNRPFWSLCLLWNFVYLELFWSNFTLMMFSRFSYGGWIKSYTKLVDKYHRKIQWKNYDGCGDIRFLSFERKKKENESQNLRFANLKIQNNIRRLKISNNIMSYRIISAVFLILSLSKKIISKYKTPTYVL